MRKHLLRAVAVAALLLAAPHFDTKKDIDVLKAMPVPVGMFKGNSPPPAPSYRNTYIDTTNATNYTFNSCDIGTAHSLRVVVLCVFPMGNSAVTSSVTVNGVSATSAVNSGQFSSRACEIWYAAVPSGSSVTIQVNGGAAGTACAISVYAIYPASSTPVDSVGNNTASASITLTDLAKTNGGFTVIAGTHNTAVSTGSASQTGAETITKNFDQSIESGRTVQSWSHVNTATTTTDDYTLSWTGTVNGRGGCAASWGP